MTTVDGQPVFEWHCDGMICRQATDDPMMSGWVSVIARNGFGEPPVVRDYCCVPCLLAAYAWHAAATVYSTLSVPSLSDQGRTTPVVYLLWDHERLMWWKPNRLGYTGDIAEAGRYGEAEALDIARRAAHAGQLAKAVTPVAAPDNWGQLPDVNDGQTDEKGEE